MTRPRSSGATWKIPEDSHKAMASNVMSRIPVPLKLPPGSTLRSLSCPRRSKSSRSGGDEPDGGEPDHHGPFGPEPHGPPPRLLHGIDCPPHWPLQEALVTGP